VSILFSELTGGDGERKKAERGRGATAEGGRRDEKTVSVAHSVNMG